MTKKDKDEMYELFAEAFHDVVAPDIHELKEGVKEIKADVDTLDRKFDAQQNRLDRHDKDIEKLQSAFASL